MSNAQLEVNHLDPDMKHIVLSGRLDIEGSNAIEMAFTAHTATEAANVIVDVQAVDFLSSMGIRLLVSNAKAQSHRGGKLVLSGPNEAVESTLNAAGITALIPFYASLDDAKAAFAG